MIGTLINYTENKPADADEIRGFIEGMHDHDIMIVCKQRVDRRTVLDLLASDYPSVKCYITTVITELQIPVHAFVFVNAGNVPNFRNIYGEITEARRPADGWFIEADPKAPVPTCREIPKREGELMGRTFRVKWYIDEEDSLLLIRTLHASETDRRRAES